MIEGLVSIKKVSKRFPRESEPHWVFRELSLEISIAKRTGLVGLSGCGKSTLMRMIAGLDTNYLGQILVNDKLVSKPEIDVQLVPQDLHLFSWLTVQGNIAFSAKRRESSETQIDKSVRELVKLVGLQSSECLYPSQLSGGMKQRLALARALAVKPKLLILDESFNSLDFFSKQELMGAVREWSKREGVGLIIITHDINEAVYLTEEVIVLSNTKPAVVSAKIMDIKCNEGKNSAESFFADIDGKKRIIYEAIRRPMSTFEGTNQP